MYRAIGSKTRRAWIGSTTGPWAGLTTALFRDNCSFKAGAVDLSAPCLTKVRSLLI